MNRINSFLSNELIILILECLFEVIYENTHSNTKFVIVLSTI